MVKVLSIIGTRPEAIKMIPVIKALKKAKGFTSHVLLTGQHRELLDQAFAQFEISANENMNLMEPNQTLGEITGRAFLRLADRLNVIKPDIVLAQGDTTTVMVAALSSFYLKIPFGHVEAGLRTYDRNNPFPEEVNREIVSKVANLHFAPTSISAKALLDEKVDPSSVVITGNTVIDNLSEYGRHLAPSPYAPSNGQRLILLTAHRRENFGAPMREAFLAIRELVAQRPELQVVYPVHPNPNVQQAAADILGDLHQVKMIDPLGYFDFMALLKASTLVITDSGGLQEEAPWFSKPVLVLRNETERPEAVTAGVAKLIGCNRQDIRRVASKLLDDPSAYKEMARGISPYGDGLASQRIVERLQKYFSLPWEKPGIAPFDGIGQSA